MVQKHISAAIEPFTNWITQKMTESSPFEQITMGVGVFGLFFFLFSYKAQNGMMRPRDKRRHAINTKGRVCEGSDKRSFIRL